MRLNRLSQRLRAYDWTAAVIELLIVIVGILIALQVSNWNQDRLDRARAGDYYRRIPADLKTDIRRIADTRVFYRRRWPRTSRRRNSDSQDAGTQQARVSHVACVGDTGCCYRTTRALEIHAA